MSLLVVLQVPSVQTRIARFATEKLESVFNARMEIGSIEIHPFNAITVHDAVLIDPSPYSEGIREMGFDAPVDTIARIGKLSATVSLKGLFHKRGLNFGRVKAEDLLFQFASEPGDYGSNLVRVLNLVSDGKESKMSMDSIFTVKHLEVKNARFRLINYVSPSHYDFGMNWGDLDVHFNLRGHDIGFFGGRMHGTAEMLTAEEKSGFKVLGLSGKCHVGQGKTILENLHLRDGSGSDIRFSSGVLSYSGSRDWGNFINAVDMDIHFQPSTLVLESIAYFSSGTFKDTKFITDIHSGHLKGTVSNFLAENLDLSTPYGPYGLFNVSMKGLPKIQQTLLDADISGLHVSSAGLQKALAALGAKANLSKLARGEAFVLDGKFSGPMNQLHGNARIASRMGRLGILADVNNVVNSKKDIEFNADLTADSFDLGKLLGTESLGSTSFTAKASGSLGGGNTALNLEELNIGRLMALGYEYKDLLLKGSFVNNDINAAFSSGDPNALLDLEGFYNLDHNSARLNADLKYVDLAALKLDTRGGTSKVSCGISADRGIWENAPANVLITDLVLTGDQGALDLGDIVAEARLKDKHLTALLNSNFVDIKYNGPSDVQNLVKFTRSISSDRDMPAFFLSGTHEDSPEAQRVDATLSAVFHDTENFLAFLMPGMAIAPDTTLNIDISEDGTMLGYLSSPYLAFNKLNVSDLVMAIDNQDETLSCTVNTDVFKVNDLSFNKACITIEADDNLATMGVNYEGADVLDGGSDFNIEASLKKDENGKASIDLQTLQSNLRIKSEVWRLRKSNIGIHNGELFIDGFRMASDRQSIAIDGRISPFRKDSLLVSLNNVDLGILNEFLKETFPRLNGIANGRVTLLSPLPSEMGLGADLSLKDIVVKDKRMGDFALNSSWNDTGKSLSFNLVNTLDEATVLSAEGSYGVKDKKVDGTVVMNGFNVGFAAPFLHEYLTELDGKLNGT
ncbi:MAG: hypothetical protein IKH11_00950, partial [Bacteroidales bacterium]|nr:hypothetical protein [Bacteroidales bacterium]